MENFYNHGQSWNDLLMQEVPWQNIKHPPGVCYNSARKRKFISTLRQYFCQAEFIKVNN